jgi:hypothetical protein
MRLASRAGTSPGAANVLDPGEIGKDSTGARCRPSPGQASRAPHDRRHEGHTDRRPHRQKATPTEGHTDTKGAVTVFGRAARHEESDA